MIEVNHLTRTYATPAGDVEALRDVCLRVAPGEIFGIVGMSGSGKSTLLRCMNLLERPDGGTVTLGGQRATSLDRRNLARLRQKVGMIFQHFHLLDARTAFENIAFPLEIAGVDAGRRETRVLELARLVGIQDKLGAYPGQLSGGQKQRVAIARALANDPMVLLCDEATSALDPETTFAILQLLKRVNTATGLTLVLVTHELEGVQAICDRVAVLDAGRVVEEGTVRQVFDFPHSDAARRLVDITQGFRNRSLFNDGGGI